MGYADGRKYRYIYSIKEGNNAIISERTGAQDWHGVDVPAHVPWLKATKRIYDGDEVLVYYGDSSGHRIVITPGFMEYGLRRIRRKRRRS